MNVSWAYVFRVLAVLVIAGPVAFRPPQLAADGFVKGPVDYEGSLEESSQEAVIIMNGEDGSATEDLILKISVEGEVDRFAWMIPLPNQPEVNKADAALFKELFDYVEDRLKMQSKRNSKKFGAAGGFGGEAGVEVLSREVVGSYDVATVQENVPGALNQWLEQEGYQRIDNGDDVIDFYREKGYVFVCVKVSEAQLKTDSPVDLHPLRFTFRTGGRDGIYFPMKMTGLQKQRFNVNLYVFYAAWLNDSLNRFGHVKRGFFQKDRDWDSPKCQPNAGKLWCKPRADPFLRDAADRVPTVAKLFSELYPDKRFYLTNIQALHLDPAAVRAWPGDLWLFPYYVNRRFIPYDVRPDGPAADWAEVSEN